MEVHSIWEGWFMSEGFGKRDEEGGGLSSGGGLFCEKCGQDVGSFC